MNSHRVITLDPGETLEVRGSTSEYEDTSLFLINWDVSDGWALAVCSERSDDSGNNVLVNNWELPPETPYAPV